MAGMLPMALYGLEVPCGDVAIPARPDIPSAYRITMAAIDPSAEPEGDEGVPARATLKIIRQALTEDYSDEEDDDDDFDIEELERMIGEQGDSDEEDSEDEEVNGGPSDPAKTKAARKAAAQKAIAQLIAEQDDEDEDMEDAGLVNGKKSAKALGKRPAADDEDDEDDEETDSDDEGEYEEFVICTLDPTKVSYIVCNILHGKVLTLLSRTTSNRLTSLLARTSAFSSRFLVPTPST